MHIFVMISRFLAFGGLTDDGERFILSHENEIKRHLSFIGPRFRFLPTTC
jgi:hypothetical protein